MKKRTYPVYNITWWIALALVALALITSFGIIRIPVISGFWLAVASSVLLLVATRIKAL